MWMLFFMKRLEDEVINFLLQEAGNEPKGKHIETPGPRKLLNYTTLLKKGGD